MRPKSLPEATQISAGGGRMQTNPLRESSLHSAPPPPVSVPQSSAGSGGPAPVVGMPLFNGVSRGGAAHIASHDPLFRSIGRSSPIDPEDVLHRGREVVCVWGGGGGA